MGWIILVSILLVIAIALFMSVVIDVNIDDEIRIKIKYAGITVFSISPDNKKKKKKKEKKEEKKPPSPQKSDDGSGDPPDKGSAAETDGTEKSVGEKKQAEPKSRQKPKKQKRGLSEKLELTKTILESAGRPAKRLLSHIRINGLVADISVSGDDAAEAALNYGRLNWLVQSVLALLYQTVRLNVKRVDITTDFTSGITEYFIKCKIKLRVSTAIGCILWFLIRMLKITRKNSNEKQTEADNTPQNTKGRN